MESSGGEPQSVPFTSVDVELAKLAVEVLDVLQVPEELNEEYRGIDNLETKIEEYGRLYRHLYSVLFLEEEEELAGQEEYGDGAEE